MTVSPLSLSVEVSSILERISDCHVIHADVPARTEPDHILLSAVVWH